MGNVASANNKTLVVVSVTSVITATAGLAALWFLYYRVGRATGLDSLKENFHSIEQLNSAIDALRKEIEELKAIKLSTSLSKSTDGDFETISSRSSKVVRFNKTLSYVSLASESEYLSAWSDNQSTTTSNEEFFDFPENDVIEELGNDSGLIEQEEALLIFEKVDLLFDGSSSDHEAAYRILCEHETEYGSNVEFLWRMAKACRMVGQVSSDAAKEKEYAYKALSYAERALEADDGNAEAHKWYAISLGGTSDYVKVAEKIKNGIKFKEHVDIALRLNPSDPVLHHLLGRFSYEVSTLSWIERKVATALFNEIPSGSLDEALSFFEKAHELRSDPWKTNNLFIAKCYIQLSRYVEAFRWIDDALALPSPTKEDQTAQEELQALSRKYSGYRS